MAEPCVQQSLELLVGNEVVGQRAILGAELLVRGVLRALPSHVERLVVMQPLTAARRVDRLGQLLTLQQRKRTVPGCVTV